MKIVYIHGANASPRSFRYIQKNLPDHIPLDISYNIDTPLIENINTIENEIRSKVGDAKFHFVCHSLGGVIAVGLHHKFENLDKTFSMSAPFGGSKFIEYLRWICPRYRLFADLKTSSPVIKAVQKTEIIKPFIQVVTSGGANPLFGEPNDGTISVSSQLALKGPVYLHYELHHFEVLLSDDVITKIYDFLFETS